MKFPQIEGYRIHSALGRGGMGAVYRALHLESGDEVALKVMRSALAGDVEFVLRFKREARALSSVRHPAVARFVESGSTDDSMFLAMEYIEGESLEERLADGPLQVDQACRVVAEVADALAAAHQAGIIHRDVKPSNIILSATGAKLTDFGLARREDGSGLTTSGRVIGSLAYMAPEQVRGAPAGPLSDIYSLGAVLFRIVTGRLPFEAGREEAMATKILTLPAPILSRQRRDAPVGLDLLVIKMLSKQPELRPQSAAEVADSLLEISHSRHGGRFRGARGAPAQRASALARAGGLCCRVFLRILPRWRASDPLTHWAVRRARLMLADGGAESFMLEAAVLRRAVRVARRMLAGLERRRDMRLRGARRAELRAGQADEAQSQVLKRLARELRMEAEIFQERIAEVGDSVASREKRAADFEEKARLAHTRHRSA